MKKPKNHKVKVYGSTLVDMWNASSEFQDTHKITFEVDEDNQPICKTIKMKKLS